ncbi:SpoIIE family protein phosphatase [Streptomyces sp. SID8367]|uniref:ATP-binding SpoIIE family protein phosphatase n=1 Tax=Streptomyces sp. PsTaAH-137 TaxID=1305830 RepID=UPI000DBAAE52|nr:ATP-binding SpoIIE family protein phosphatase [Streptomyces sp. PsTaAH-137]MYT73825.1 SpoIIE family protein phosphatase [Streptomyces sp. SID8367]
MSRASVTEPEDVVWLRAGDALAASARREATALARRVGFTDRRIADVSLAVTEIATNLLRHAEDGAIVLRPSRTDGRVEVECLCLDTGPGMADVAGAVRDGHSSTGTLGIGLGAIERLADTFDLHSLPGRGTALLARFRAERPRPATADGWGSRPVAAGLTRPISGETVCGDTWAVRAVAPADGSEPGLLTVLMCDGLGHGPLAARVSDRARQIFRETAAEQPRDIVSQLHEGLRGSRGAALAVAEVDRRAGRVTLCGIGNISAFVVEHDRRSALLSHPGIVGVQMPTTRTYSADLTPGSALVMHSDGLHQRWSPTDLPGLLTRHPSVIAGQILNQAGLRRDDAGIVVVPAARR